MPPKKGTTKAKAPAAAAPTTAITTSKSKEIEATAAAGRPKRATAAAAAAAPVEAPAKKASTKKTAPKTATPAAAAAAPANGKKRGRPPKADPVDAAAEPPKKRGRTAKAETAAPATATASSGATKKPGRPKKKVADAPAVPLEEEAPPKPRGQPPKGGETTKIEAAEEAAAEQLEGELVEAVETGPSKPNSSVKRGRGRPPKQAGAKKAAADAGGARDDEAAQGDGVVETPGKQYWLMKAEQEDREETLKDGSVFNAKFTIDDLRDKRGPEPWDGVRNPTACKNMREMKLGDLAFFYASGGKKGRVPGITGIMEIVREHEPDPSAWDENSPFYVENEKSRGSEEKPRWMMVQVEFRKKLSAPVTLTELKKYAEKGSALADMQELNAARLSVSKVSEDEWNFIIKELVEGYEVDTNAPAAASGSVVIPKTTKTTEPDLPNGAGVAGSMELTENDVPNIEPGLPIGTAVAESKEFPASDATTTDTALPLETAATSSRPASRAGSKKPTSRAGSLAPTGRAASRARSRTPAGGIETKQTTTAIPEEMEVIQE